jgi:hypothetical protein
MSETPNSGTDTPGTPGAARIERVLRRIARELTMHPADKAVLLLCANALAGWQRDGQRLEYLLESDSRFRRFSDGDWGYQDEDENWHYGKTWRLAIDAARAASPAVDRPHPDTPTEG